MGVRGLTTFIAKNASRYLEAHELHDCNLVIDGDNLCSQLYKKIDHGLSAFGGQYDDFFREIVDFFMLLKKCRVTPYVLLDGGYELKKLKTVRERLRSRIGVIKYIVPLENYLALPLMMREVFTSALKHCNIPVYRCLFEADNEIAMLARKLNCPVLSYDSDFYIFDGQYIPYVTITPRVYKKTTSKKTIEVEIMQKKQKGQKKKKAKKVTIELEEDQMNGEQEEETYNYLDCCIYTIENLTEGCLDNDMLPLFAIMLGNDFISRRWFSKFYRNVSKRKVSKKKNASPQQRRIQILLAWLQHETLHSAIKKILECVKQQQRAKLWYQIRTAMNGYRVEKSKSFEYFGFEDDSEEIENDTILDMRLDEIMALESEPSEASENEAEEQEEEEMENSSDEMVSDVEEAENCDGFEAKDIEDEDFLPEPQDEEEADEIAVESVQRKSFQFPEWFVTIFQTGSTPRFLVDLIRSHRYINYPQVENFHGNDSNAISYQILYHLYAILLSPKVPRLYYYTRIPKQVRYEVKKFDSELFPIIENFDPTQKKNVLYIKKVFERSFSNVDEIFKLIEGIPENHQLFILAVVYWIKRSTSTDSVFLQAVILCLIALNVIDKKCDKIHRDGAVFTKKYEKHLKELKEKEVLVPAESLNDLPLKLIIKNVTKSEALLCMDKLVSHFTLSPKFARKHADFRRNVVHTFSELQSVIFNLYALNAVLQFPFENIRIENYFNGLFLYNMYLNLKSRANSLEYIRSHLLNHSTALMMIFNKFYDVCLEALPYLRKETTNNVLSLPSKAPKKVKPKPTKKKVEAQNDDCHKADSSDNEEFIDLNNKFSQLLMM